MPHLIPSNQLNPFQAKNLIAHIPDKECQGLIIPARSRYFGSDTSICNRFVKHHFPQWFGYVTIGTNHQWMIKKAAIVHISQYEP